METQRFPLRWRPFDLDQICIDAGGVFYFMRTQVIGNSYRRVLAIIAGNLPLVFAVLVVLGLSFDIARAAELNPAQPIRVDGMELFFGVILAEILRGHPREHEEQTMHGGVPSGRGVHHLVISVFDAKTRARITDAAATGSVAEVGMATQNQKLEAMSFGGTVSYGNYFTMTDQGPYEIVVNVRRPGDHKMVTARFQYWHPPR